MDTICRDCVFAQWHGSKQADCSLERLFKFEEQGAELVLEDDGKKQYARIKGRFCNTCRSPDSVSSIPSSQWADAVRKEVTIPIAMAVYVDDDSQMEDAFRSLTSFIDQTTKPKEIILVYNVEGRDENNIPFDYHLWFVDHTTDLKYRIQIIRGILPPVPLKSDDTLRRATYGDSIDLAMQSDEMESIYFTVCQAGYEYPTDYVETIDKAVNDELQRFVALLPDKDGNAILMQRRLHKLLQGNKQVKIGLKLYGGIIDKVIEIAQEEGNDHLIKRFEDLK